LSESAAATISGVEAPKNPAAIAAMRAPFVVIFVILFEGFRRR
jgi:hypothetical protein